VHDETRFATGLAGFLAALYAIDPTGGPAAGAHSFLRGGPLDALDVRQSIAALAHEPDADAASAVQEVALASVWERPSVWVYRDVTNSNLLVQDGRLCAVLDFGCSAVGDPACDLAIAGRTSVERAARRSAPDSRSMKAPGRAAAGGHCGRR
jgi:aminoglycoside phosphotransferase (APT) family kinase protein